MVSVAHKEKENIVLRNAQAGLYNVHFSVHFASYRKHTYVIESLSLFLLFTYAI